MLQDLAVLTGGDVITADAGLSLERMDIENLGVARRVVVGKESRQLSLIAINKKS